VAQRFGIISRQKDAPLAQGAFSRQVSLPLYGSQQHKSSHLISAGAAAVCDVVVIWLAAGDYFRCFSALQIVGKLTFGSLDQRKTAAESPHP